MTRGLVAEYLEVELLGFKPGDPEIEGAFLVVFQAMQELEVLTDDWRLQPIEGLTREAVVVRRSWAILEIRAGTY